MGTRSKSSLTILIAKGSAYPFRKPETFNQTTLKN